MATLLGLPAGVVDEALAAGSSTASGDRPSLPRGTTVCFTGALTATFGGKPISRSAAERLASDAGLTVLPGVSQKLDILVVADPDTLSGKARRARELGTRILAEAVFWQAIGAHLDE